MSAIQQLDQAEISIQVDRALLKNAAELNLDLTEVFSNALRLAVQSQKGAHSDEERSESANAYDEFVKQNGIFRSDDRVF